jgi:hypothetical protein
VVLDSSNVYGVNIKALTEDLPRGFLLRSLLKTIYDDSNEVESLGETIGAESSALLIDDMNAILHLLSSHGQKSGIHILSNFYHLLSYHARINKLLVLGTVYRTSVGSVQVGITRRSLPKVSDLQITTEVKAHGVMFRCNEVAAWPTEGFRTSLLGT